MLFSVLVTTPLVWFVASCAAFSARAPTPYPSHLQSDLLTGKALFALGKYVAEHGYVSEKCTIGNVVFRRDWDSFSKSEKGDYIKAVKCLMSKPAKTSSKVAPGAKSRYDDFVATHIAQTLTIHGTGNFLSWHRYFVWTYEKALRDECGYQGYQPYYNWPRWASNPINAPVFDGSSTSMSGNGAHVKHNAVSIPNADSPFITLPAEQGGGCVQEGPFKDMVVNLGPVSPSLLHVTPNPLKSGLGHNPRCLRRDISTYATKRWSTDASVVSLIRANPDIYWFQTLMQGDFAHGFLGTHTAGHFTVGGDPGGDLFASPGDPYFFLHHAMIDRTWWTWQNLHPGERTEAVSGTRTLNNQPPSKNTTLEDVLELGVNAGPITIRDASSTVGGAPFCYLYV